jgi:hypothetical protein
MNRRECCDICTDEVESLLVMRVPIPLPDVCPYCYMDAVVALRSGLPKAQADGAGRKDADPQSSNPTF